jgi:quinol monooxygenase YgiN
VERYVFAKVTARPGNGPALRAAAQRIVPATRAEDGCLAYGLFQSAEDENELWFSARWRDQDALDAHGVSAHVAVWLGEVDRLATGPVQVSVARDVSEGEGE